MRALVLSGGGAKGAYQVGAIQHLMGHLGIRYDIVAGTSVGALNAAFLAMYPPDQGRQAASDLLSIWQEVDHGTVWKKWYWGLLGQLPVLIPREIRLGSVRIPFLGKQSVYNTAPLRRLVDNTLDADSIARSGTILRVGAVSLSTGERRVWTERDTSHLRAAVLASSSFPMFFEPVHHEGEVWTDDGVREVAPIEDAILAGATAVDVIGTGPDRVTGDFDPDANGLELGQRILDSMSAELWKNDIRVARLYNAWIDDVGGPDVPRPAWAPPVEIAGKKKIPVRLLQPENSLGDPLDFSAEHNAENISLGLVDAQMSGWG